MGAEQSGRTVTRAAAGGGARRHALIRLCVLALCVWLAVGTLRSGPFYLTYFNELIGGPANGYKYLSGPDVDWGQGLKALAGYLHRHGIRKVKLAYFGTDDPRVYGIDYELVRPGEPATGYVAVSASFVWRLHGGSQCDREYGWLQRYQPIVTIADSILLYHIPSSTILPPAVSLPPICHERSPLLTYF